MKNLSQFFFFLFVVLPFQLSAQQWYDLDADSLPSGSFISFSSAIDKNGTIYCAYTQHDDNDDIFTAKVKKFNGTTWENIGASGISTSEVPSIDIALDNSGTPFVFISDGDYNYKAAVKKFSNGNWELVGSGGFSGGEINLIKIAVDKNGTPYVAFSDANAANKLTVMKFNGSNWVLVGNAGFSNDELQNISFILDENNVPYVAYEDNQTTTVVRFTNGSWEEAGTSPLGSGNSHQPSLTFDKNGVLYAAFEDAANGYRITVKKLDGNNWVTVGTEGVSGIYANDISMVIDENAIPYVIYSNGSYNGKASVLRYSGGTWESVGPNTISSDQVSNTSIHISPNGIPVASYLENDGSPYKAVVKKFSELESDPLPVELSAFFVTQNSNNVTLHWQTATETNNAGFDIEKQTGKSEVWKKIGFQEGSGTSNSVKKYSYTEKNLSEGKYFYRLKQIDRDGKFSYSQEVEAVVTSAPKEFSLLQNYPNPFNPTTTIQYSLPANGNVTLTVYDLLGKEAAVLVNGMQLAGNYSVSFNASQLSSGVYFYRLQAGRFVETKRFTL
ncbi:MAG: T9SS type A sorting domain-containing protein, partial [Bacteroidetes bacterium]|nr:T9SS type A sorting domain-containing protein [Bacteroidota bacterium]